MRRHQRYIFNLAYRVLGDYAEAEDITQETFACAWRGQGWPLLLRWPGAAWLEPT